MTEVVCNNAQCSCTFGSAKSSLVIPTKKNGFSCKSMQIATENDYTPMENILPFGMCKSLSNPSVSAATAAAYGALTPMPCMPKINAPWLQASQKVKVNSVAVLLKTSQLICQYGGEITIIEPGQTKTGSNR